MVIFEKSSYPHYSWDVVFFGTKTCISVVINGLFMISNAVRVEWIFINIYLWGCEHSTTKLKSFLVCVELNKVFDLVENSLLA